MAGAPSLQDALAQYVTQEVLDGSNQWNCDRCAKKVDALKGLQLKAVPPLLTIQLKVCRFANATAAATVSADEWACLQYWPSQLTTLPPMLAEV